MSDIDFWVPGNLVVLKEPFKPETPSEELCSVVAYSLMKEYRAWPGFTHGIIVQVISHDHLGEVTNVSLHLYDPKRCCLYVEPEYGEVPRYVDFHISELSPLRRATDPGYETMAREK